MTLAQENLILSLIGTEPDGLKPIEVQKLMFMYSRLEESVPSYEFLPFKQGSYSSMLAQDVRKLEGKRLLQAVNPEDKELRNSPICFEMSPAQCHRARVLNALTERTGVQSERIETRECA